MQVEERFLLSAFANDAVDFDSFRVELEAADATLFGVYLGGCNDVGATEPTELFLFSRVLTAPELTTLAGVVAAHQGDPLYANASSATVAVLADTPGSQNGQTLWATDGRKVGEGAGNGTGVSVYWDVTSSTWRVFSDDTVVQA